MSAPLPPQPSSPSGSPARLPLRAETPPAHYWRRWAPDAAVPLATSHPEDDSHAMPLHDPVAVAAGDDDRAPSAQAPYRVLIVEDDRSQALFAQSVLHGAGITAEVEMDANQVLPSIQRFAPDLLLMDLHMPGQNGMALTMAIRARPEYLDLPIVFLTGDPDPERQYEVLDSGADDFLTKPIRPRHLIAAVSNRIQRMRQRSPAHASGIETPASVQLQDLNPETGLHTRSYLQQQLDAALEDQAPGGLFFIEIAGALGLRERYGYAASEQLLTLAARKLSALAAPYPLARLNDNSFLSLTRDLPAQALAGFARSLHDQLAREALPVREGESIQLRAIVGYADLEQGFVDRDGAIAAIEQAAVDARIQPGHVAAYVPAPLPTEQAEASLGELKLELLFQPIVSVAGGNQPQFQALMRLRRADGTLLPAAQVVPAAERSGEIIELDRQVIGQALDLIARRQAEGGHLKLFVSQSPQALARSGAAAWLLEEISRRGVEPASLVIDVRLSDALTHTLSLQEFAQATTQAGVQLCLGQFEPGTEARALLSLLPLRYVRISNRFASAHKHAALRDQLRATIELAHEQDLLVIGQQIEDPQAAAAMWMDGVDFIQGNLVQGAGQELGFDFQNLVL